MGAGKFVPFNAVWNHLGNPAMTVPAGVSASGMPLSVQLVAPPRGEDALYAVAGQLERARPWAGRVPEMAS